MCATLAGPRAQKVLGQLTAPDTRIFGFLPQDFLVKSGRPPPQTGRMTWTKLRRLIREGYGQGHLHDYKPWLRVTKKDYSPVSNVGHLPSPELGRHHHYRARGERNLTLVIKWLGGYDARDQYPAWPWEHDHALCGLPGVEGPRRVPGIQTIAAEAGIQLWPYPGSDVPYVATIDLLSTWRHPDGFFYLVAHDCKPEEVALAGESLTRVKQRLLLLRRYCLAADIPWKLSHPERLPKELVANLDALAPRLRADLLHEVLASRDYAAVVDACRTWAYVESLHGAAIRTSERLGLGLQEVHALARLAIWRQDLDHDLSIPFEPWLPLTHGGIELKKSLYSQWCVTE